MWGFFSLQITHFMEKKAPHKIIGYLVIAFGILATIAKIRAHQGDMTTGQIVKVCLIIGVSFGYGLWVILRKKSNDQQ